MSQNDEVTFVQQVKLNQLQIKNQLIELFKNDDTLQYELNITMLDARGREEEGSGVGVTKEAFTISFTEFFSSCTVGRNDKVSCVWHDISKPEWSAVPRILIAAMTVGYYPLALSPAFVVAALFGEHKLTDKFLLNSFKDYASIEEKENIQDDAELLELLSFYNCYRRLTKDNLHAIIIELAHQEIVQKPRYIATCFMEVMCANTREKTFSSVEHLEQFYQRYAPTAKKIIHALVSNPTNDAETSVFTHLTRYVKSLIKDDPLAFLRYITASDLTAYAIVVDFKERSSHAPVYRTSSNCLTLSSAYPCYHVLAVEITNILKNKESFNFYFTED